ncbi:MAG: DUF1761 domain-containing protein [Patescibacteria group bacterium]
MLINIWAVILSALVSFGLGWLWYSNKMFGQKWRALAGYTEEMHQQYMAEGKPKMRKTMAIYFVSLFFMAYVLAYAVMLADVYSVIDAIRLTVFVSLGFVLFSSVGTVLWHRRPWKLYYIEFGYMTSAVLVSSIILALW